MIEGSLLRVMGGYEVAVVTSQRAGAEFALCVGDRWPPRPHPTHAAPLVFTSAVRPTVFDVVFSLDVTAFHCDKWMRCSYVFLIAYANAAACANIEQLRQSSHSVLERCSSTDDLSVLSNVLISTKSSSESTTYDSRCCSSDTFENVLARRN